MKRNIVVSLVVFIGCATWTAETAQPPNADAVLALYVQISMARLEAAYCQGIGLSFEKRREMIRDAVQDLHRLREEFGTYIERGQIDPYCGPICEEMLDFLEAAEDNGFLPCREE